uniref:Uncharacterized protein n=1 Tax=Arion vulgaris TaxID=1028688 RepID=A0A0B7A778_9EUPU
MQNKEIPPITDKKAQPGSSKEHFVQSCNFIEKITSLMTKTKSVHSYGNKMLICSEKKLKRIYSDHFPWIKKGDYLEVFVKGYKEMLLVFPQIWLIGVKRLLDDNTVFFLRNSPESGFFHSMDNKFEEMHFDLGLTEFVPRKIEFTSLWSFSKVQDEEQRMEDFVPGTKGGKKEKNKTGKLVFPQWRLKGFRSTKTVLKLESFTSSTFWLQAEAEKTMDIVVELRDRTGINDLIPNGKSEIAFPGIGDYIASKLTKQNENYPEDELKEFLDFYREEPNQGD